MNRKEMIDLLKHFIANVDVEVDSQHDEGGDGEMYCYAKDLVISYEGEELKRIRLD